MGQHEVNEGDADDDRTDIDSRSDIDADVDQDSTVDPDWDDSANDAECHVSSDSDTEGALGFGVGGGSGGANLSRNIDSNSCESPTKEANSPQTSDNEKCNGPWKHCAPELLEKGRKLFSKICDESLPKYECNVCKVLFFEQNHLTKHLEVHDKGLGHICGVCGKRMMSKLTLQKHIWTHSKYKLFSCNVCDKSYSDLSYMEFHAASHVDDHALFIYKCKKCGKKFKYKAAYMRHAAVHVPDQHRSKERPFVCKYCQRTCATSVLLKVHVRIHTGEKTYKCKFCQKRFTQHATWTQHVRIHTGEKPFKCPYCPWSFVRQGDRRRHMYTHAECDGEIPQKYICDVCGQKFSTSRSKRLHKESIHLGLRPFKCEECGRDFGYKSIYNKHKRKFPGKHFMCSFSGRTFRDEKQWDAYLTKFETQSPDELKKRCCFLCGKMYAHITGLARHMKEVHEGVKCCTCCLCGKVLSRKDELRLHLQRIHKLT
jgi:KRAB domain-containing zinc finger protein